MIKVSETTINKLKNTKRKQVGKKKSGNCNKTALKEKNQAMLSKVKLRKWLMDLNFFLLIKPKNCK